MAEEGATGKRRRKSRMAARVRNINMLLLILILALVIVMAAFMVTAVTGRTSKDLAFFYSLEAVNHFNSYISRDLALVQKVARSKAVTSWFADENNPVKRAAAYHEMMDYLSLLNSAELYFGINESLNEFSIKGGSIEELIPFDTIDMDDPYNSWYFDLIASPNEYAFNIDIDKLTNERRIWINHKVVLDGEIVGVFCSGLQVNTVFRSMFDRYHMNNAVGFMIDRRGFIQLDNDLVEHNTVVEQERHILMECADPMFLALIDSYSAGMDGYFGPDAQPEVVTLFNEPYGYASVAPLTNSDWLVVSFYNSNSLFSATTLLPLVLMLTSVFILYALASNAISRHFVLMPLHNLTISVSEVNKQGTAIKGSNRDDEIGELARTIQKAWNRVKEEHKRTQLLLDTTPLAAHLWDRNIRLFDCNEESVRLFKMRNKQEYLDRFGDLSPEYQPDGTRSSDAILFYIKKAFEEGSCIAEWMHQRLDGTPIPSEVTLVRVEYEDGFAVAGYVRDLREYKRMMHDIHDSSIKLEEALKDMQKANNAKSDFLASMSHEMRTPLNAIIGLSGLSLENNRLDEETFSNLEKIYHSGEMLLSIVNDILDISKIEAGRMELVNVDYDVPSLINDTVTQNILRLGEKPIQLELDIDEDMFSRLHGDELRTKQIMNNLLSNAIKYTEKGTVELSVQCERDNDRVWVTIRISDTGKGIRPDDMDRLFKDYSQLDLESNRKAEGTGLGLPITKSLVDMMDGTIDVKSEYGKGSVFTVRIAQKFISDVHIGPDVVKSLKNFHYSNEKRGRSSQLKRIRLPYARVLVVDDNATNLEVAKGLMKPYGMQIDCVTGGQQAIDAIRDENVRYNAVFMDHMMPDMDGIEATRIIREEIGSNYAQNIPIIALTANAIAGNETMFLSKGFQAFISKPIEIARLDGVIRRWVRDKNQEKLQLEDQKDVDEQTRTTDTDRRRHINHPLPAVEIKGLNIRNGIERFGGNTDQYFDILRSYATHTPMILNSIKDVCADAIGDYAIIVHGIKGSNRNISADELGDVAERLEKAARAGDYEYISTHNPPFLKEAWELISAIEEMIAHVYPDNPKPQKEKPDMDILKKLLDACKHFETDAIDTLITELDSYDYQSGGDLIAELLDGAKQYHFKDVKEKLLALFDKEKVQDE